MSDISIQVENLGKRYRIGAQQERFRTLRDSLVNAVTDPIRRFRQSQAEGQTQDTIWALKDVSFEVKQGEVLGIIGRNGAGKSTLLKILSHITDPTEGRVMLRGRVGSLLEVGTGFHPELTGRENIYLNGAILGMKKVEIERKFDEIVAFAEIEKFLDTSVKRYSSGMYVRLAFAVAAHLEPEILVVDEVLAVGDAEFQRKCLGKMGGVAREGRTVLFVSHNMAAIRNLCSTAILLEKGNLAYSDSAKDVVDYYLRSCNVNATETIRHFDHTAGQKMYIKSICTTDEVGHPTNQLKHDQESYLIVEYVVEEPVPGAYICAEFHNSEDVAVFWVSDANTDVFENRLSGKYRAKFKIPRGFFPAGYYFFHAAIFSPGKSTAEHAIYNAYSFDVLDATSLLASKGIRFPAVVSLPVDVWTEKLDN
jgi:lipopolysaccharide transport system ATP-binding protein